MNPPSIRAGGSFALLQQRSRFSSKVRLALKLFNEQHLQLKEKQCLQSKRQSFKHLFAQNHSSEDLLKECKDFAKVFLSASNFALPCTARHGYSFIEFVLDCKNIDQVLEAMEKDNEYIQYLYPITYKHNEKRDLICKATLEDISIEISSKVAGELNEFDKKFALFCPKFFLSAGNEKFPYAVYDKGLDAFSRKKKLSPIKGFVSLLLMNDQNFLDCFFLSQIFMQFFTGIVPTKQNKEQIFSLENNSDFDRTKIDYNDITGESKILEANFDCKLKQQSKLKKQNLARLKAMILSPLDLLMKASYLYRIKLGLDPKKLEQSDESSEMLKSREGCKKKDKKKHEAYEVHYFYYALLRGLIKNDEIDENFINFAATVLFSGILAAHTFFAIEKEKHCSLTKEYRYVCRENSLYVLNIANCFMSGGTRVANLFKQKIDKLFDEAIKLSENLKIHFNLKIKADKEQETLALIKKPQQFSAVLDSNLRRFKNEFSKIHTLNSKETDSKCNFIDIILSRGLLFLIQDIFLEEEHLYTRLNEIQSQIDAKDIKKSNISDLMKEKSLVINGIDDIKKSAELIYSHKNDINNCLNDTLREYILFLEDQIYKIKKTIGNDKVNLKKDFDDFRRLLIFGFETIVDLHVCNKEFSDLPMFEEKKELSLFVEALKMTPLDIYKEELDCIKGIIDKEKKIFLTKDINDSSDEELKEKIETIESILKRLKQFNQEQSLESKQVMQSTEEKKRKKQEKASAEIALIKDPTEFKKLLKLSFQLFLKKIYLASNGGEEDTEKIILFKDLVFFMQKIQAKKSLCIDDQVTRSIAQSKKLIKNYQKKINYALLQELRQLNLSLKEATNFLKKNLKKKNCNKAELKESLDNFIKLLNIKINFLTEIYEGTTKFSFIQSIEIYDESIKDLDNTEVTKEIKVLIGDYKPEFIKKYLEKLKEIKGIAGVERWNLLRFSYYTIEAENIKIIDRHIDDLTSIRKDIFNMGFFRGILESFIEMIREIKFFSPKNLPSLQKKEGVGVLSQAQSTSATRGVNTKDRLDDEHKALASEEKSSKQKNEATSLETTQRKQLKANSSTYKIK